MRCRYCGKKIYDDGSDFAPYYDIVRRDYVCRFVMRVAKGHEPLPESEIVNTILALYDQTQQS